MFCYECGRIRPGIVFNHKSLYIAVLISLVLTVTVNSINGETGQLDSLLSAKLREEAMAKFKALFYNRETLQRYMQVLNDYYQLHGRPRFGKRSRPISNTEQIWPKYSMNRNLHQSVPSNYYMDNNEDYSSEP